MLVATLTYNPSYTDEFFAYVIFIDLGINFNFATTSTVCTTQRKTEDAVSW